MKSELINITRAWNNRNRTHDLPNVVFFFVDIKGLYSNQPGHSCKDIRDSEDSKEGGKFWINHKKSGNPLTEVYCEIANDGGKLRIMI